MSKHIQLAVNNLHVDIASPGGPVHPVDGISFSIRPGETFALLGESGCGKSMTALSMMRLLPHAATILPGSEILLDGQNLLALSEVQMRAIRGRRIGMIFQEPMTSLNAVMTIGDQIGEAVQTHLGLRGRAKRTRIVELLDAVGIHNPSQRVDEYPHQFSGGMKQRVMIAMALAGEPELLIADEPTTALDVTIQAQILDLLKTLQQKTGMAMMLITHDLGVVKQVADHLAVMYAGHIVEAATATDFFANPQHPYSQMLFAAMPSLQKRDQSLAVIKGMVPPLNEEFLQCRYLQRCDYSQNTCEATLPRWTEVAVGHGVRCHLVDSDFDAAPSRRETRVEEEASTAAVKLGAGVVLDVENLKVHFPIRKGIFKRQVGVVKAVDGVSFQIKRGQTLAIVGESGCGKTTLGKGLLRLLEPSGGTVIFENQLVSQLSKRQLHSLRKDIQIIFQDPYASMNPRMMIRDILAEGLCALKLVADDTEMDARIDYYLQQVGLPVDCKSRYPHEFSGGQRQRICIARALVVEPKLIVCDEPTSALDVSVQAQILNLLKSLQQRLGLAYLFISHDLSVVSYLADDVIVMYAGKIVEQGPVEQVLQSPQHVYTKTLLAAIPH